MIQELREKRLGQKKLQVCYGNGNIIFFEDDNFCHRHFAVSPLISDAPGQSSSALPSEEKHSLNCMMTRRTQSLTHRGVKEGKKLFYYQLKGENLALDLHLFSPYSSFGCSLVLSMCSSDNIQKYFKVRF